MRLLQKLTSPHLCFLVFVHLLEVLSLSQIFLSPFETECLSNWEDVRVSPWERENENKNKKPEQQRLEPFDARTSVGLSALSSPGRISRTSEDMKAIVELSLPGNRQSLLGQIQIPKENPSACGRIGSPDPVPGSLGSAWVSHVEEDVTLQVLH